MPITADQLRLCDFVDDGDTVLVADVAGEFMMLSGWSPETTADFFICLRRNALTDEFVNAQIREYLEPATTRWTEDESGKLVKFPVSDTFHFGHRPLRFAHLLTDGLRWLMIGERATTKKRRVWPPSKWKPGRSPEDSA